MTGGCRRWKDGRWGRNQAGNAEGLHPYMEGHEAGEKSELLKNAVIALVPSQPEIAPVSSVSSFWDYFNEMKISRESGACPEIGAKSR
jgi:hypothetical protein